MCGCLMEYGNYFIYFPPPSLIQLLIINMAVLFRSILPHYQSEHHKYTQIHGIMTYCLFALHRPTSLNTEKIR